MPSPERACDLLPLTLHLERWLLDQLKQLRLQLDEFRRPKLHDKGARTCRPFQWRFEFCARSLLRLQAPARLKPDLLEHRMLTVESHPLWLERLLLYALE